MHTCMHTHTHACAHTHTQTNIVSIDSGIIIYTVYNNTTLIGYIRTNREWLRLWQA